MDELTKTIDRIVRNFAPHTPGCWAAVAAAYDAGLAAERERCAKLCEEVHADTSECPELALHCAARIRGA